MFFVDVGQGDGALIIGPQGTSVLVDGGASNSARANLEAAMNHAISTGLTDNTLDYCVNSHLHADHLGAMELVAQTFAGGLVWAYDRGGSYSSTAYTEYNNYFGASGLNKRRFAETFSIGTGCTMVYCGHPTAGTGDENNNGVLYRLDIGNFKASLCGDLGGTYEVTFAPNIGDVDHYKVNHHGSRTSSQTNWINAVLPRTHTFSYGVGNSYGHPHSEAVSRLSGAGSTRFDTIDHEASGKPWVHLSTDGISNYVINGTSYALEGAPPPVGPAAPSNLVATAASTSEIGLTWTDNSTDESSFIIGRSTTNGGPYSDIATVGANVTSFSNGGLSAGTTYYYVVRASNANGDSANSTQASATTQQSVVVVINEAMPAPSAGSEWVELYNMGTTTVDLAGWTLDDLAGGGSAPVALTGTIAPGAFFVHTYSTAVLNNTGDDVNLINASGQVVSTTTYGSAPSDQSWARSTDGTGAFEWDATPSQAGSNNAPAVTVVTYTSNATDDGWVLESSETSNIGGSTNASNTTILVGDDKQRRQYKGIVSFDTSGLPDSATVTGVKLKVTRASVSSAPWSTLGILTVDISSPYFGASAAMATADFAAAADAVSVGTVPQPTSNGQTVEAVLNSTGAANINKTGKTQLRLRFTGDDDNDSTADNVSIRSGNYSTASTRPQLEVTYSN